MTVEVNVTYRMWVQVGDCKSRREAVRKYKNRKFQSADIHVSEEPVSEVVTGTMDDAGHDYEPV